MSSYDDEPIELYLDELLGALRGTRRDVRHMLAECEAHLRDNAQRAVAAGSSPHEAARGAVERFGDVSTVAAAFNPVHQPAALRAAVPGALFTCWRVIGVGFTAIGGSGVLAWILMHLTSTAAVFADPPGTTYGRAACAYWQQIHPTAKSCAQAALLEGRDDALVQRFALGALGLFMLAAASGWQRRRGVRCPRELRFAVVLVAATVFGIAGITLTGYGIDRAVQNTGAGQWLSAGAVALTVATAYLIALSRYITTTPPA